MSKPEFKLSVAIVVGINDYQNGIPPLGTARQDAEAIAERLSRDHHYHVHLITESSATTDNLMQLLETEVRQAIATTAPSRFLFYFAGHGIALNGDDGPEGYLILHNSRLGDVSTYLPMAKIYDAFIQLSCRHFLGILDCCFAGAFRWASTRKLVPIELGTIHKERFDRFIKDPAWQVITSAAYDQTALDNFDLKDDRGQKEGHSPFAAILLDALQGHADAYPPAAPGKPAGDGVLTATELYMYLRDRLEAETDSRSVRQTPGICPLKKHDKGEYIFLTPGHELNLPPAPPLDVSSNPYRGLESFNEANKDLFFGRKALTQQLVEFVASRSLTVVLGASGSGKSSIVKAGLLPTLRQRQNWYLLPPLRLGESPFKALNQAIAKAVLHDSSISFDHSAAHRDVRPFIQQLAAWFEKNPQAHLVVVVDQLEELITLNRDEQERQQFLALLAEAIANHPGQLHLVLTLRSDFEPQFRSTTLEPYWKAARFIVPAMTREELRQAIEEPASARVMYFSPNELVDQLIDEVANMPGALPLLSFALSELYLNYLQRQEEAKTNGETLDRAITQADYEEVGGVTRSLTQRAEREYLALVKQDPAYEHTIRNVMLRMVSVGGEIARRRVLWAELDYPYFERERIKTVLERFETARLLTPGIDIEGERFQEPAHDALVLGWERLITWRRQHLSTLILQRDLASDVNHWKRSRQKKRDSGLLWIENPRLPTALQLSCGKPYTDNWSNLLKWWFFYQRWQSEPRDCWFNTSESEFIWQSFDQKFKRFGKTAIAIVAVMLALSGVTLYAFQRATIAQFREQSSRVLTWLPTPNATAALVLAIDTMNWGQSIASLETTAQSSLLNALQATQELNLLQGHKDEVYAVAFSLDGTRIVSGGADNTVLLWDAQTGQRLGQPLQGHEDAILAVTFNRDGTRIASGGADNTIRLWNAQTGQLIGKPLQGHEKPVRAIAFSPDSTMVVSSSEDSTIRLWDAQTLEPIGEPLRGHNASVWSVAFSPDGIHIASASADKTIRLWDAQTRQPIGQPMQGHQGDVSAIAFSPGGTRIVSGSGDTTVRLWDAQTRQPIGQPMQGHEVVVSTIAFSPDGKHIASGSWDKTVRLWDAQTRQPVGQPMQGHDAPVSAVAFSPDGKRIVSGSADDTIRLWNAQIEQPIGYLLRGHDDKVYAVAFSPDGTRIASGSADNTIQLWNARTKQPIGQPFKGHEDVVRSVAFSPDGKRIVSGSADNTVRLWNVQTKQPIGQPLQGHKSTVRSVAFNPDGIHIVSGSEDHTIRLWDAQTGEQVGQPLQGHGASVNAVAFSPNGKRIVSSNRDKTVRLWNAQTGEQIGQSMQGHGTPVSAVAFSPDGTRIVSGSEDRTVRIWNAETGQPMVQGLFHGGPVGAVAFSPDGKRIVSGSADQTVRLWDAQTGEPIGQPLQGHRDEVYAVAFSADGTRIISGSGDRTVRLWDAFPTAWMITACDRLQAHPILNQPETIITDPELIDVAHRAKAACQQQRVPHPPLISWFEQTLRPTITREIRDIQKSLE